jgi:NAD(P)H-flavin reductase
VYRFIIHHILSRPDGEWTGETGYIRGELLHRLLPPLSLQNSVTQTLVCVCGPTPFSKLAVKYVVTNNKRKDFPKFHTILFSLLKEHGYNDNHLHVFLA